MYVSMYVCMYVCVYECMCPPRRDWCVSRQLWWGHRIPAYFVRKATESESDVDKNDPAHSNRWYVKNYHLRVTYRTCQMYTYIHTYIHMYVRIYNRIRISISINPNRTIYHDEKIGFH